MIWIALLITAFLALGLRRRVSPKRGQWLVFVVSSLTMGAMYVSFGNG